MSRLYDPPSGSILVDGQDLRSLDITCFHNHIAVVNQNPLLFNSSIGENIAYGAPEKVVDEKGGHQTRNISYIVIMYRYHQSC